jgi:hypothetical protein
MGESVARIGDPVIAINIAGTYRPGINARDLYNCTRGTWRLSRRRASTARYAFSVYRGVIREVYEVDEWVPAGTTPESYGPSPGRYEFVGRVAEDEVRDKYVGKRLLELHGQNPIRYFNC